MPHRVAHRAVSAYVPPMDPTPLDTILDTTLATLTHADRMKRMVALGRAARADDPSGADARAAIVSLRARGVYGRLLALATVHGSEDGAFVLEYLSDPSRTVRRVATSLLPRFADDAHIETAWPALPARARPGLLRGLRGRRRGALVDALVARALAASEPDAVDLLPYATAATFEAHAARLDADGSPVGWERAARWHPEWVAGWLASTAAGTEGTLDMRVRWRFGSVSMTLVERVPDAAVSLGQRWLAAGERPAQTFWARLARLRPEQTLAVLRTLRQDSPEAAPPGPFAGLDFGPCADRLAPESLAFLAHHAWETLPEKGGAARWQRRLSPAQRAALVEAVATRAAGAWGARFLAEIEPADRRARAFERWVAAARGRQPDGIVSPERLAALPRVFREREARRHLESVPALAAAPRQRVRYAALLGFADAQAVLTSFLGHPEGEVRADAAAALLSTPGHDRAAVDTALAYVIARRFEQDPVRQAMITALLRLPRGVFAPASLPAVGQIAQHALDAADLSGGTAAALEALIVRLFPLDPAWGARWLTALLEARGTLSAAGLAAHLNRREVMALAETLGALAEAWTTRERAGAVLWLAGGLGARLSDVPGVVSALARLAAELPFVGVAGAALGLLRRHAPRRFAALVPELVRADPTFVVLPVVSHCLSMHRQDLLDVALGGEPMRGRFASGRTVWVLNFGGGYGRWHPAQQSRCAAGLARIVDDPKRDVGAIRDALDRLVELCFIAPEAVLRAAGDARPPVRELGVRALPRLDGGEGVPLLLECLNDDRARFAIYALRKVLSELPKARALQILETAPMERVTVAKEVVRLLGELGGEAAFRRLLQTAAPAKDTPRVHRDIRIAALRGLWHFLDRDETWSVFEKTVQDPDWVVAGRLADLPQNVLPPAREARMTTLLAALLSRPEPEARLELLNRLIGPPVRETERRLFSRMLDLMGARAVAESTTAFATVLARMRTDEVSVVAGRLASLSARRRTYLGLLDALRARLGPYAPEHIRAVAVETWRAIRDEPLSTGAALRLAGVLLPWSALADELTRLSAAGRFHADALAVALEAARRCVHPERLERALATEIDSHLRRVALEALRAAAGPDAGWTTERCARLDAFRRDPAPLVAEAAWSTFPPEDETVA